MQTLLRIRLVINALIFCLLPCLAKAQNLISIDKAGFDSITIYNKANHSIVLEFRNSGPIYIYKRGGIRTQFKLNAGNVRRTVFKVSYDRRCFDMDVELCKGIVRPCLGCLLTPFLRKDLSSIPSLFGCPLEQWPRIIDRLDSAQKSNASDGDIKLLLTQICFECCKEKEQLDQDGCIRSAMYYLNNPPDTKVYRAQDLITLQEKFAIDFSPYYLSGWKQPGLTPISFSTKKFFGFRATLDFNLYQQKRRISGRQIIIPFDYQSTPVAYKKNANPSLPDTGYSWRIYSLGIGYRYSTSGSTVKSTFGNIAVIIDAGVSINKRKRYTIKESVNEISDNINKTPIAAYFNFGYQIGLFRGIGLSGSYYTNILLKKNQPPLEMPKLHQFNLGLYINLFTQYSYQY